MGKAIASWRNRDDLFVMTKDCAHDRKAQNSMVKLEQSLRRLQVDCLDLWQLHEVVWDDDPDWIFAPGGSAEALLKAKEQGKVRYIGFTGHKHPEIHKRMLSQGFPFDAVQMPLNALDAHCASFEREIVPICQEQGIAVIGMKSFAAGVIFKSGAEITPARGAALRDEPAGRDGHQRDGLDGGAGAEPRHRPVVHAADRGGTGRSPGPDARRSLRTAVTSGSRRPATSTPTRAGWRTTTS